MYAGDPLFDDFQAEQLHEEGNTDGGHYIVRNHEIDIELPSHFEGGELSSPSLSNMKCNTWRGELRNWGIFEPDPSCWKEYHTELVPCGKDMADRLFHEYRIDWHNDRVEFFIDEDLKHTTVNSLKGGSIPDIAGHFTFGVWFPSSPLSFNRG